MEPADHQTLPHRSNVPPEAPQRALSDVLAPAGQLALLGAAQLGLDGRAYAVRTEGRSPEPLLGPNAEFCTEGKTELPGAKLRGGAPQLVLDLGDLEAVPQLGLFQRQSCQRDALKTELGDAGFASNLHKCDWTRVPLRKDGVVIVFRDERGNYHHTGNVRCQHWCCALCGPKRARSTASALGLAIDRWLHGRRNKEGGRRDRPTRREFRDVWMLTLTLPHRLEDMPGATVEKLYLAHALFKRSAAWRNFCREWGIKNTVRVLDNVHGGKSGTHPHFHIALFPSEARDVDYNRVTHSGLLTLPYRSHRSMTKAERAHRCEEIATVLWGAWHDALRAAGVEYMITGEALKLSPGEKSAGYFTSWGLSDEVGATTQKARSHLRLLDAVGAGVAGATAAYVEWVASTHGKQWVTGLDDLCTAFDITDDDIEQHVGELRDARDAAAAARGEPVQFVRPLQASIPDGLYAAALSLGWPRVHEICDAADAADLPPQLALVDALCEERRRLELRDLRRRGRAPP